MASIHISKPGKVKSVEGVELEITPAILSEVQQTYDPANFEAQLVIGHPSMDAPSFGGIRSLSLADDGLEAAVNPTDDAKELVDKRHFKTVSSSFYTPTAPNNPTPGKWHLRHVGLLGAVPPAVKGLRALSFAEAEEGVVTFGDLPGYAGSTIARLFGNIRDWFIAKEGTEVADRVLSAWELDSLRSISQRADEEVDPDDATQISGGTPALSFAEPGKAATSSQPANPLEKPHMKTAAEIQAELDAANAKLAQKDTELQALQQADAKRAADARHSTHVSFADGLVAQAKLPADFKDVIVATLDHLTLPSGVVSFGEGDAAKPLAVVLQEKLTAMPAHVSFGEFAKNGGNEKLSNRDVSDRAKVYMDRMEASGRSITISQAIDAVNAGTDKA